ncbi:MAG: hypothetical protein EBR65_01440 [Actinobacteria bacterium]|nr:hypothetical protein [Actinomycetota bacterium]
MTSDRPGSLAWVARLCRDESTVDRHWAEVLGRDAVGSGPGERQRFLIAASHRHADLADRWDARLPITDDTARMLVDSPSPPAGDTETYRAATAERSQRLAAQRSGIDSLCDPATDTLITEAIRSLSQLVDEAGRAGV